MKLIPVLIFITLILLLGTAFIYGSRGVSGRFTADESLPVSPTQSLAPLEYIVISETPTPTATPKPTPTPPPTPIPLNPSQLDDLFTRYANTESINRELLKRIAVCESGLNPLARGGPYGGLYQFSESSWISTRREMNLNTETSLRFIPEEAIRTAAFKIATQGIYAWPNCSK